MFADRTVLTGPHAHTAALRDSEEPHRAFWVALLAVPSYHRHIDGAAGSQFLADVAGILEDPGTALLF